MSGLQLAVGAFGEEVSDLQGKLRAHGFVLSASEVNRKFFGPTTREAVRRCQEEWALAVTGVVDERTWGAIDTSVARRKETLSVKLPQSQLRQPGVVINDPKGSYGMPTRDSSLEFQRPHDVPTTAIGARNAARQINAGVDSIAQNGRFVVRGQVRNADGTLVVGSVVRAFDEDLRSEEMLGESITDLEGRYEITYTSEQFRRAEKKAADLIVRAFKDGQQTPATSKVLFNAPQEATVPLSFGDDPNRGPAEYDELLATLTPVLQDVPIADLTDDDVAFLAGETEQEAPRIRYLIAAAQLANQTALPPEAFYGFARQDLPTPLPALLAQHPRLQRLALLTAIQENIIPARLKPLVDGILERLQQLRVYHALRSSGDVRSPSLGDLLSTCLPENSRQQAFASLYLHHEGSLDDFWPVLRGSPDFKDEAAVQSIQLVFGLAAFTQSHLSMVQVLQQSRSGDARASLRALAKHDVRDWMGLIGQVIGQNPNAFPPEVEGDTVADKTANYAEAIAGAVAEAFPTAVIAHRLEADEVPHKDDLLRFFAGNPDFELASMPIQRYVARNPQTALAGIADKEAVTGQLQSMERVFKITPDYSEMRVLLRDGVDSAHSIAAMGQEMFVAEYGQRLNGEDVALDIYSRAANIAAMATGLQIKFAAAMDPVRTSVDPDPLMAPEVISDFPEWKTLFGALELCACEHCRSVLSPAAYLVDVLHFLAKCAKAPTGETPLQILLKRRADIQDIKLSCENTNTPLPYIDLVNEVLENEISPFGGGGVWQTRAAAEELSAYPEAEHFNPKAYNALANVAVYPWHLPFNLWLEQVRLYLNHAGVQLYQVMETYLGRSVPTDPDRADSFDTAIAAEYLGFSPQEWRIVARRDLSSTAQFWGFAIDPSAPDAWIADLKHVSIFLERSSLSFADLLELLQTDFIDPPPKTLEILPKGECDPDKMRIDGLSRTELEKIHRFVRLSRKLGWSFGDLDRAIAAFKPVIPGDVNLTEVLLVQLSHVARLHAELGVPVVELLAWWAEIDMRTYDTPGIPKARSLYERLFRDRAVLNPIDPDFGPDGPVFPVSSIGEHALSLQAALRIGAGDLKLLTDSTAAKETLQLSRSEISPSASILANVSQLYRVASLSKALDLSIPDFLSLKALVRFDTAIDASIDPSRDLPLDPFRDTASTQRFASTAREIAASPFSIEQLDYLLRDALRPSSSIAPAEGEMRVLFDAVRTALGKIEADTAPAPAPTHDLIKRMLAQVMPATRIESALALIMDKEPLSPETRIARSEFISLHFAAFLDPDEAKSKLLITDPPTAGSLIDPDARFAYALSPLLTRVRQLLSEQEVIAQLAGALSLEAETAKALLSVLVTPPLASFPRAIDVFLSGTVGFGGKARMFRLLHKIAMLVNGFGITVDELSWLFDHGPPRGWLDFNHLPLAVADKPSPHASLVAWKRLAAVYDLFGWKPSLRRDDSAGADPHRVPFFHSLLGEADKASAAASSLRSTLAMLMGWHLTDEIAGALANVLPLTIVLSYKSERGLRALKAALDMAERLVLPPMQLRKLCNVASLDEEADKLMRAVRSGIDNGQAVSVIKPVSDALREKQRSALVSYLVFHKGFRDSDDLFAELLIDVEMSSCQLTSRIKQAMSSAQLFVQRALMGREKEVSLSRTDAQKWEWTQNYRVWEANRKVFLWPENWIEPQLRDDKTEFFKELENDLLQDEITPENVESAFLTYLIRLDDIAQPEVCAMYQQQEPALAEEEALDILHVVGRTRSIPHIYYYRRREHQQWTAWEKVDLDIEGDHLLAVVFERRLRLFWPVFTERTKKLSFLKDEKTLPVSAKYWDIQLASSVHTHLGWSPKTVSAEILSLPDEQSKNLSYPLGVTGLDFDDPSGIRKRYIPPKSDHLFKARADDSSIYVTCYVHDSHALIDNPTDKGGQFEINGCRGTITVTKFIDDRIAIPWRADRYHQKFVEADETKSDELFVIREAGPLALLNSTPGKLPTVRGKFQLLPRHQDRQFDSTKPFFFEDVTRTFLVTTEQVKMDLPPESSKGVGKTLAYVFGVFYHPYSCNFIKQVNRYGVEGLLNPDPAHSDKEVRDLRRQLISADFFVDRYKPNPAFVKAPDPHPLDDIDFRSVGAYSQYNWELFFHIPLMLADQLSKNQRFDEAHRWFQFIFDPTDTETGLEVPGRYWRVQPFFKNSKVAHTIAWLMHVLEYEGSDKTLLGSKADFKNQIEQWAKNPFNPHLIARLRISAYQKTVVMKYIDNLIAWGDELFRRETIEAINEATQLYVMAAAVLGAKPRDIPARNSEEQSFRELAPRLDDFSNAPGVAIESFLPVTKVVPGGAAKKDGKRIVAKDVPPFAPGVIETVVDIGRMLYFCIPKNDTLLRYWDTVADRLFKIRHCMNIEGIVRQLPLFEPPIDPALLVRATAAGLDLSSVLNELSAPLPPHRFNTMVRSALEFCSEVQSLGAALLSAMEKRDAEDLAGLRMGHEIRLLEATALIKKKQVEDSVSVEAALRKAREMADARYQYYVNRPFINIWEIGYLGFLGTAEVLQVSSAGLQTLSAIVHTIPETTAGTTGVTITFGGIELGMSLDSAASALGSWSSVANIAATASATIGSYQRRQEEWDHQADLAMKEGKQIDQQILGAQIRVAIAEQEVKNHALQTRQAKEVDQRMRSKFTNRDLYTWTSSQLAQLYFQSYRLAYDLAKRAEMCFAHELGKSDSAPKLIEPHYWDSMKRGLLAGEKLRYDLKRLEAAYLEQNRREYEITKHISLAVLDPLALLNLKQNGRCFVSLGEALFDSDYPGHYFRRIKSTSLSIPCVTGPNTSVNCTLTLLKNSVRITSDATDASAFRDNMGAIQSIATSSCQNDSGMFELLFRDDRYLPFEGAGAISTWQIDLPRDCNQLDFNTISDVIIHLKYTARPGGALLQNKAKEALKKWRAGPAIRLFSARLEFPDEWYRFLHPEDAAIGQSLALVLRNDRFPFQYRGMKVTVKMATLFLKLKEGSEYVDTKPLVFDLTPGSGTAFAKQSFKMDTNVKLPKANLAVAATVPGDTRVTEKWLLEVNESAVNDLPPSLMKKVTVGSIEHSRLNADVFEDLLIACEFKGAP